MMSSWRRGSVTSRIVSSKMPSWVTASTPTSAATAPPATNRRRRTLVAWRDERRGLARFARDALPRRGLLARPGEELRLRDFGFGLPRAAADTT
jgi:hypothetical protein